MQDIYKNFKDFNQRNEHEVLIVFDDMIADIISNKKNDLIMTELFIRGTKTNNSFPFIT